MRCNADLILARTLANAQENETVEYKDRKNLSKDDVGKYFSALSNKANLAQMESAWLLFGITDDGQVSNSRYLDTIDSQNEMKRYISEQTSNRMSFLGIHERMIDDKRIVLMEIPAALSGIPTSFKGIAYERQGESLLPLSDEKRLRIMGESAPDWSAKLSDNANVCDLDPDALELARIYYKKNRPSQADECEEWSDEMFLDKTGLRRNGRLTFASIVLLGKEGSEGFIDMDPAIRWILKDKDGTVIDSELFGLPLLISVEKACSMIRNVNYWVFDEGRTTKKTVKTYDEKLLREALYNCIGHQDYTKGEFITVEEIERDKLVFRNAGSFIPESIESVIDLDRPEGYYRNRCLVRAMYKLGLAEIAGGGIIRMFRCQIERSFPLPDYIFDDEHVTVIISGHPAGDPYSRILAKNPKMPLSDLLPIDALQKGRPISEKDAERLVFEGLAKRVDNNIILTGGVSDIPEPSVIRECITQRLRMGDASKSDIVSYIESSFPGCEPKILSNSISNGLSFLRKDGTIVNLGTNRKPMYHLNK